MRNLSPVVPLAVPPVLSRLLARTVLPVLLIALGCASVPVASESIDWRAVEKHWSLHIVTIDPDGDERVTRIWLAVVDGRGALRTGDSRWWANLERDRRCAVRIDGSDYPLRAQFATSREDKIRIDEAFATKYGRWESLMFPQARGDTHERFAFLVED